MRSPVPESKPSSRAAIITTLLAATALALAGCSALRLGYGQADRFAYHWFDRYVDFDGVQEVRVRGGIADWFAWHRRTQLPDYAELLSRARSEVLASTSPERTCALWREVRARADPALERAAPAIADVLVTLTPAQIARIERRHAERNAEFREDFVQADPARRRRKAVERAVDRAETLYGSLDDAQRAFVARSVAESPFDAELWLAERQRRQQDALQTIRRLVAARISRADAEAQVRLYVQRLEESPNEAYRRHADRLLDHNCGFAAALHNLTTPAQRAHATRRIKGWEDDLRALAGVAVAVK